MTIDNNAKDNFLKITAAALVSACVLWVYASLFSYHSGIPFVRVFISVGVFALVSGVVNGRPGRIGGASLLLLPLFTELIMDYDVEYFYAACLLGGIFQLAFGYFKLGKFIRLVPHPVMMGFVSGLAVLILFEQLALLEVTDEYGISHLRPRTLLKWMCSEALIAAGIMLACQRYFPKLPAAFLGFAGAFIMSYLQPPGTVSIGFSTNDFDFTTLTGMTWMPQVPFNAETFWIIMPYALIFALASLTEGLMNMSMLDQLSTEVRGRGNRESVSIGISNVVCGLLGLPGGTGLPAVSLLGVRAGGVAKYSGVLTGLFFVALGFAGYNFLTHLPLGGVMGIMIVLAFNTFSWSGFRMIGKMQRHDAWVLILVAGITVVKGVFFAVISGLFIAGLVFAWESAKRIRVRKSMVGETKHYEVYGPLFFGSIDLFMKKFDIDNDPEHVTIDFSESRIWDQSGIEALNKLAHGYASTGRNLVLANLSRDSKLLLEKAGNKATVTVIDSNNYHVVTDSVD